MQSLAENMSKFSSVIDKVTKSMFLIDMGVIPVGTAVNCSNYYEMLQSGQIDIRTYQVMVKSDGLYSAADAGLTAASLSNPVTASLWGGVKGADVVNKIFNLNLPTAKEFTVQSTAIIDKLGPLGTLRAVGDEMANSNRGDVLDGTRRFLGTGMQGWATAFESFIGIINVGLSGAQ
jgi:hypothetical protein